MVTSTSIFPFYEQLHNGCTRCSLKKDVLKSFAKIFKNTYPEENLLMATSVHHRSSAGHWFPSGPGDSFQQIIY